MKGATNMLCAKKVHFTKTQSKNIHGLLENLHYWQPYDKASRYTKNIKGVVEISFSREMKP